MFGQGDRKMDNNEIALQENLNPSEPSLKKKNLKSRKLKFIIPLIIFAFLFTAVCGIVSAQKKFRDGPEGFIFGRLTENLNLNENQKAQLEQIRAQIREKMESKKTDRDGMMDEFANEFKKDNLDKSKLLELSKKKEQDKEEMKSFMMDKIIEFHNILTPEQRNKAVENMKEMKNKFHNKFKHDGERPDSDMKNKINQKD